MFRFLRKAVGHLAHRIVWMLIDEAVEFLRARLRKLLTREHPKSRTRALPPAAAPVVIDADVVEESVVSIK
jgi:hypothetical protein